jgi:hypothetical protein
MKSPATPPKTPRPDVFEDLDVFGLLVPEEQEDRSVETELRLDPIPRSRSKSEPENYWI